MTDKYQLVVEALNEVGKEMEGYEFSTSIMSAALAKLGKSVFNKQQKIIDSLNEEIRELKTKLKKGPHEIRNL